MAMSEIFKLGAERRKIIENWRFYVEKIAKACRELLKDCEVFVFGSVIEGKWTGGSDVDVLLIGDGVPLSNRERAEIKAKIEEAAGLPLVHPFEIHLIDRSEVSWYKRHIKKAVRIM